MWISKIYKPIHLLILPLLLSAGGCSSSDTPPGGEPENASLYLRLQLEIEGADETRANPSGGEDGDGREDGLVNENDIHTLDLVFYHSDSDDAINLDPTAKIVYRLSFTKEQLDQYFRKDGDIRNGYYLIPIYKKDGSGYNVQDGDRIFVFANASAGSLGDLVGKEISSLRDLYPAATWNGATVNSADYFTMATAHSGAVSKDGLVDGKIYFTIDADNRPVTGDKDDPLYVKSTIERTAARIDFMYPDGNLKDLANGDKELVYEVSGVSNSKVHITHIRPVNTMTQPSWYFKQVQDTTPNYNGQNPLLYCKSEYGEKEKPEDTSTRPDHYVIEPTTDKKTFMDEDAAKLPGWYGASAAANFTPEKVNEAYSGFSVADLNSNGKTLPVGEDGDVKGTGWSSLILAYTNENTIYGKFFSDAVNYLTGLAFRAVYKPSVVYSDKDLTEDESYEFGDDFWRFSPSKGEVKESESKYFSNEKAATDYKLAHPELNGIITKYKDGVCYYNLWIRHAGYDGDKGPDPANYFEMQYAIVRNNIYRIKVTFSGPGNSDPGLREPHNVQSRVFVRKWNLRTHSPIIM